MCRVSIIIPVYNSELTLARCLDSILKLSYNDYEVILIDDGSTDMSGRICDEYAAQNHKFRVFHQQNGGVSSARNLGVKNAVGEWIVFCDSDDWVDQEWLSSLILVVNYPEATLLVNGIQLVGLMDGKKGENFEFKKDTKEGLIILKQSDTLGYLFNKIFNRKLIIDNSISFNPKLRFREDEDFVLRYLRTIDYIVYSPVFYYNYEVPDLSTKYLDVQMFDASLSMYTSIIQIYGSKKSLVLDSYRKELINAFFDTYRYGNYSRDKVRVFCKILSIEELGYYIPRATRLILKLPICISNTLLLIKSKINNLLTRIKKRIK